jgi:conjugative relaxase-like TrwC/TraI family protein
MLSLRTIRDAAHVQHYFSIDDLTVESRQSSAWEGQWARAWALAAPVDSKVFRAVLEGCLPSGRAPPPRTVVRGVDATFSAPKSVSIAALVWGDRRLVDAHDQAVREALSWVETEHCYFRKYCGRNATAMAGSGLLAATFRHGLSRLADPQLHTHAVILNLTATPDGTFRALDREFLFNAMKLLGGYYRLDLAARVARLGYSVRPTAHAFEIGEIPGRLLALWSKRSHAVEQALARGDSCRDLASGREKQYLTLVTRPPKVSSSWATVAARWREEYSRIQPERMPALPWRGWSEPLAVAPSVLAGLVGETVRELGAEYGSFRRIEIYGRLFSRAVGRMDAGTFRTVLPGLLEGMTVPAVGGRGRCPCFGSDWHECPDRPRSAGPAGPVFYLCWGNGRDLLASLGSCDPSGSVPPRPDRLQLAWSFLEVGAGGELRPESRCLLFYLPRRMPLAALETVRTYARDQGLTLVLIEWPRREYGLLRLRGLDYLRRCGDEIIWLRDVARDAFIVSRSWRRLHERELTLASAVDRRRGLDHGPTVSGWMPAASR